MKPSILGKRHREEDSTHKAEEDVKQALEQESCPELVLFEEAEVSEVSEPMVVEGTVQPIIMQQTEA